MPLSTSGSAQWQLYAADCSGSGGTPATGVHSRGNYLPLTTTGGVATATWVVLSTDPAPSTRSRFPYYW